MNGPSCAAASSRARRLSASRGKYLPRAVERILTRRAATIESPAVPEACYPRLRARGARPRAPQERVPLRRRPLLLRSTCVRDDITLGSHSTRENRPFGPFRPAAVRTDAPNPLRWEPSGGQNDLCPFRSNERGASASCCRPLRNRPVAAGPCAGPLRRNTVGVQQGRRIPCGPSACPSRGKSPQERSFPVFFVPWINMARGCLGLRRRGVA